MCGRYTLVVEVDELEEALGVSGEAMPPRYNIAPTQLAPIVRVKEQNSLSELAWCRWGLIPSWSKDPTIGSRLINARSESVAEKPAFRGAFRHRRCLVPATGFYEWQKLEGTEKNARPNSRSLSAITITNY